jgi:hypothetical protein
MSVPKGWLARIRGNPRGIHLPTLIEGGQAVRSMSVTLAAHAG